MMLTVLFVASLIAYIVFTEIMLGLSVLSAKASPARAREKLPHWERLTALAIEDYLKDRITDIELQLRVDAIPLEGSPKPISTGAPAAVIDHRPMRSGGFAQYRENLQQYNEWHYKQETYITGSGDVSPFKRPLLDERHK